MKHSAISKRHSTTERFAALSRIGTALMGELDEDRLLHLIAETARDLTDASFAAFSLRPVNEEGQPIVPSEGNLFHLAAVIGVTKAQEELFRRMPLGGEGLLAPIFRHGVPILIPDALAHVQKPEGNHHASPDKANSHHDVAHSTYQRDTARELARDFSHGTLSTDELQSMGVPHGHPVVRSFLGAPVLDRNKEVRGGLLLGHTEPDCFTEEDKILLIGLAAQAAVAIENARLYRIAQMRVQELNAIFESITDGVTLVDNQGNILRENTAARQLREMLNNTSDRHQANEDLLHTPAKHALNGHNKEDTSITVFDANKETREYIVSASPLRPPKMTSSPLRQDQDDFSHLQDTISGAVVVWHDVTETRRLQDERRTHAETEARYALLQMLLDEFPGSVYLVRGHDAQLVLANHASTLLWSARWTPGQPMADFLQENDIRIFGVDGHRLTREELATIRAVQNGERVHHQREVIRHADGTTLPVLVNAVALNADELKLLPADTTKSATGEPESAAIVLHQDVTALKEAEQIKDDFIAIAAHELRNPLAILKGFAQILKVQTARGNGPKLVTWQEEALQGIDQATSRMVELIDDLLDVTRLQAGQLELYLEPTDIIALIRRVVKRLQVTTEQHTLSIQTSLDYLVVSVDPRRIEQVLNNIIHNAIKYSPDGGLIKILIHEDTQTKEALINIHDNGIGIPVNQQAHIFGRFVRADNARVHQISGTGLGLYLCREFVERHGGHIRFESAEGKGSIFFIILPLL